MKKIGITGVMGAGKSSVIEILKESKYTVLDCDRINDELLEKNNEGYQKLVEVFHEDILDENKHIDRKKLSDHIFCDKMKKTQAEAILHPLIQWKINEQLHQHKSEQLVFVEVPLLFEVKWESLFDEVWVVASDEALLLKRLQQHRGVQQEDAKRRLAQQMSQEEKIQKADVVVWNNFDKEHLKQQIYDILNTSCEVNRS